MPRRALLIATDRYDDPGYQQLRAPAGDVAALREALADPACGGFEVDEPLLNQDEPTLRVRLEEFFDSAAYEDLLLLYLSGHGELKGGRLYFATTATRRNRLRATALVDSYIHELMLHSAARSVVLVLDCCHSGAFGKGIAKAPPDVDLDGRFSGSGRMTLAASAQIEYASEGDTFTATDRRLVLSVFTAALVDGLHQADANGDGVVTLDELFRFVSDEVRRGNPDQTPRLIGDRSGEIVMSRGAVTAASSSSGVRQGYGSVTVQAAVPTRVESTGPPLVELSGDAVLGFDGRGERIAVRDDGVVVVHSSSDGAEIARLGQSDWKDRLFWGELSDDGNVVAASCTVREYVAVWTVNDARQLMRLDCRPTSVLRFARGLKGGQYRAPNVLRLSPNAGVLALAFRSERWELYDVPTGRMLAEGRTTWRDYVRDMVFAPSGLTMFLFCEDQTLREISIPDGAELGRHHLDFWLESCQVAKRGNVLGGQEGNDDVRVFGYDGTPICHLPVEKLEKAHGLTDRNGDGKDDDPRGSWRCSITPDGTSILAVAGDFEASLWNVAEGALLRRWALRKRLRASSVSFALSPDGRRFAISDGSVVSVWPAPSPLL